MSLVGLLQTISASGRSFFCQVLFKWLVVYILLCLSDSSKSYARKQKWVFFSEHSVDRRHSNDLERPITALHFKVMPMFDAEYVINGTR